MEDIKPSALKKIMVNNKLAFSKNRGQNFLIEKNVLDKLSQIINDDPQAMMVEIGAGLGALTHRLKNRFGRLIAYEIDKGFVKALLESGLEEDILRHQDFTRIKPQSIRQEMGELGLKRLYCMGNLPYSVGSRIMVNCIASGAFDQMVFTLQKEVVDRIFAKVGDKRYGILSILCQCSCHGKREFDISPKSFMPVPKVCSSVLSLKNKGLDPALIESILLLAKAAFAQRRKMLINSLSSVLGPHLTREIIDKMGLKPDIRPERIDCETFVKMAEILKEMREKSIGDKDG